jgi:hypothetical protein
MSPAKQPEQKPDYLSKENDNQYKEWEKTREVFKDYDTRLHELRKYGFSFVTALLTVGSFLTQTITDQISTATETEIKTPMSNVFNLGVFIVTLLLIVALHLFDKNYRIFEQAAYTRAVVIERKLNMELTEIIGARHRNRNINFNVFCVYSMFIWGVAGIGIAILHSDLNLMYWLIGSACAAWFAIIWQSVTLRIQFRNKDRQEDWTISPLECSPNDIIRITLNNFRTPPLKAVIGDFFVKIINKIAKKNYKKYEKRIVFPRNKWIWKILDQFGEVVYEKIENKKLSIDSNHIWFLKPCDFKDGGNNGPYQLQPKNWSAALPISIIVSEKLDKSPSNAKNVLLNKQ